MAPPREVVEALNAQFRKPKVDPEWLDGCCDWLMNDQNLSPVTAFPAFMERVKDQLFKSDLQDSMLHGTGLDVHIANFSGLLQGPPVLVQIMAITEIGTSASQLEQIRAAREERTREGVGNVEGEEDGDVEVEGEGPMPKYPRGTLHFQLTDGATVFEAMEYRHLPQFNIGSTPLGFKLQLKGTRFQNGMAFLEPATVILHGGYQEDLDADQLDLFKRGLYERLGRPIPPAAANAQEAARAPLRDISPPPVPTFPQHDDDVDMEPRRRVPAASSVNKPPSVVFNTNEPRRIASLPSRHARTSTGSGNAGEAAAQPQAGSSTSAHFNQNATASGSSSTRRPDNMDVETFDFNFAPTTRQQNRALSSPSPEAKSSNQRPKAREPSFDFDLLNELDNDENVPPAPVNKGKGRAAEPPAAQSTLKPPAKIGDGDSSDYDMYDDDFADPEFLEGLDKVEKAALEGNKPNKTAATTQPPSSASASGKSGAAARSQTLASTRRTSSPARVIDVIEIDDSEEEDKENVSVPTRHIRRRTEDADEVPRGRSPRLAPSQPWRPTQGYSQKTGKPLVLARTPSDVIDLSDSD